jgi:hypothetical protein
MLQGTGCISRILVPGAIDELIDRGTVEKWPIKAIGAAHMTACSHTRAYHSDFQGENISHSTSELGKNRRSSVNPIYPLRLGTWCLGEKSWIIFIDTLPHGRLGSKRILSWCRICPGGKHLVLRQNLCAIRDPCVPQSRL